MRRPTEDPDWDGFVAAWRALGLNPRVVESDAEYANHLGPQFFALYRTGVSVGRDRGEPTRRRQLRFVARLRAGRLAQGLCPDCGGDPVPGRRRCGRCLELNRAACRRYYRRRYGT